MNMILQSPKSQICGQCCIAMVTGKTVKEVQTYMPTRKKSGTQGSDIAATLTRMGVRFRGSYKLQPDSVAICRIRSKKSDWGGHWVVWNKGEVLDPSGYPTISESDMQFTEVITLDHTHQMT